MKVVLGIRSDNHAQLMHMFSVFTVNDRTKPPPFSHQFGLSRLLTRPTLSTLITQANVEALKQNLVFFCQQDIVQVH